MIEWIQENVFGNATLMLTAFGFVKAFAVCMFALNVGVILTWAERRVRCMIQDAIGPNRAGIPLPGKVAAIAVAAGPSMTAALAVVGVAFLLADFGVDQAWWGMLFSQAAIFVTWVTLASISRAARRSEVKNAIEKEISAFAPRDIALVGIFAHVALWAL